MAAAAAPAATSVARRGFLPNNRLWRGLRPNTLKSLLARLTPETINLAGGLPPAWSFPFKTVTVELDDAAGTKLVLENDRNLNMQYGVGQGLKPLADLMQEHVQMLHSPPSEDTTTQMTLGNTDSTAVMLMLYQDDNPHPDGQPILCDEYSYSSFMDTARSFGYAPQGVPADEQGMRVDLLRARYDELTAEGRAPRLMYIITHGANPTGVDISTERARELYAFACEKDLCILEDDPYYYLQLGDLGKDNDSVGIDDMPGIFGLPPTLLAIDTEARVARLDSFSKILAPGLRLGILSAHKAITEKYAMLTNITTQQPAGLSQSVVIETLRAWGPEGLDQHIRGLQLHYYKQRNHMITAAEQHLTGLAEWTVPRTGMFFWFRVLPRAGAGADEVVNTDLLSDKMIEHNILCVPGSGFSPTGAPSPFLRATFANASAEQIDLAFQRLATALTE